MQTIWRQGCVLIGQTAMSFIMVLAAWLTPSQTYAFNDPANACDEAAIRIAEETKVPVDLLLAITRTETGRVKNSNMNPWPWTVNMEGKGVWFDTEDQARVYVFRHFIKGARSFDIGCFQINYKWHGHAFASIEEMFDPVANARYAATFLAKHYAEYGQWDDAVGAYHSQSRRFALRYLQRFAKIRAALDPFIHSTDNYGSRTLSSSLGPRNSGPAGPLVPLTNQKMGGVLHFGHGG